MSARILLVEDDPDLRRTLSDALDAAGYQVTTSASLEDARREVAIAIAKRLGKQQHSFDIVLLDLNLPDGRGETLLRQLRDGLATSVLVISATHEEGRKIQLLDEGADDYLVKPFSMAELLARLRVTERHRRQLGMPAELVYENNGLKIDLQSQTVSRDGQLLHLTRKEMLLLGLLARQPGRVYTHHQLLNEAWGAEFVEHTHYLRIYMAQLRTKIERNPADPAILLTETGVGYRLKQPA
jgi:two-component system KDP operon response regulator KdpE